MRISFFIILPFIVCTLAPAQQLEFKTGDRIVLIGNTFAERMQHSGFLESAFQYEHPDLGLTVRNMGWSGDEVALMPRPLDFGTLEDHLTHVEADVILLCFGFNESFKGEKGLKEFETDLRTLIDQLMEKDFNGESAPRLALISPIAHEKLPSPFPDPSEHNHELQMYTETMRGVAKDSGISFVDLYQPSVTLMSENRGAPYTINGIHLTDRGYRVFCEVLATGLGVTQPLPELSDELQALIVKKNEQFFLRWRPINGEYVYGRRKEPFGVISYPPEMVELDRLTEELDGKIWAKVKEMRAE